MARTEPGPARRRRRGRELVRATRPRQWSKNLLVFAAPAAVRAVHRGRRARPTPRWRSSRSRWRPRASTSSTTSATSRATAPTRPSAFARSRRAPLGAPDRRPGRAPCWRSPRWSSPGLGARPGHRDRGLPGDLPARTASYSRTNRSSTSPSSRAGFLLRAIAGGAAAGIELSQWFLLAAAFGSLFMAAGKRYAEILLVDQGGPAFACLVGVVQPVVPAVRLDGVRRAVDHDLRVVGLRARRRRRAGAGGTSSRWRRSCWRCCATRSTWTRAAPASRRTWRWTTGCSRCSRRCWLVMVAVAVYSRG